MQSNYESPGARGRPATAQLLYLLPAVPLGALSLQLLLHRAPEQDKVMADTKSTHTERRGLAWDCVSMSQVRYLTGIQYTPTRRLPYSSQNILSGKGATKIIKSNSCHQVKFLKCCLCQQRERSFRKRCFHSKSGDEAQIFHHKFFVSELASLGASNSSKCL